MRAGRRDQAPRSSAAIWVVAIWVVVSTAAHRPFAVGMTRKTDRGLRCKILVRPDAIRTRMKTLSSAATGKSSAPSRPASSAGQGKLSRNGRFQARRATLAKQHGQTTLASAAAWRACGLDQVAGVAPGADPHGLHGRRLPTCRSASRRQLFAGSTGLQLAEQTVHPPGPVGAVGLFGEAIGLQDVADLPARADDLKADTP